MSVEVIAVWFMLANAGSRTVVWSEHLTENSCREAIVEHIDQPQAWPKLMCIQGMRRVYVTSPIAERVDRNTYRTTVGKNGTCTGDDTFCGRNR